MNSHSGDKPVTYRYQDSQIEVLPYFLYEVSIYKAAPKMSSILSSKFYTSKKLLEVEEMTILKRFRNFDIERYVTLLGAPQSFIEENNLPIYELKKRKSKKL